MCLPAFCKRKKWTRGKQEGLLYLAYTAVIADLQFHIKLYKDEYSTASKIISLVKYISCLIYYLTEVGRKKKKKRGSTELHPVNHFEVTCTSKHNCLISKRISESHLKIPLHYPSKSLIQWMGPFGQVQHNFMSIVK